MTPRSKKPNQIPVTEEILMDLAAVKPAQQPGPTPPPEPLDPPDPIPTITIDVPEGYQSDPLSAIRVETAGLGTPIPAITVMVPGPDWDRLMALLSSVEQTKAEYDSLKQEASDAKKAHDAAQAALERALARIRDGQTADAEPTLPFDAVPDVHQSDVVQAAHDDPAVMALTERLRGMGQDWTDLSPLTVAGYSDTDRTALTAWLDGIAPYAPAHLLPSE
mgnify:CR=1 FL=1